jgi:xanthine dehydrogenase large subunit
MTSRSSPPIWSCITASRSLPSSPKRARQARHAAALAKAVYDEAKPLLDVAAARAAGGDLVTDPLKLERGDVAAALAASPRRLKGSMAIGGQDHFYLESQIALAIPGEDRDMLVLSSTQHPSEVQHMVAMCSASALMR